MNSLFLVFSFIVGTLIGSFLNVVALRYNTGMTLGGRSKCFSCGKSLSWHELIPIFSFLFQKGECKKCRSKISLQYPLIEAVAGVFFILIFIYFPPLSIASSIHTLFYIFITCILLVITIYDIKHKIIPEAMVYTFIAVSFAHIFLAPDLSLSIPKWYEIFSGPIVALPFAILWLVSGGRWMGLGDAKLMVGIGYTLGLFSAISSIILSFWIGAIFSLLWMFIVMKKFKKGYEIPFGPYLIVGMYIVLFTHVTIIDIPLLLSL